MPKAEQQKREQEKSQQQTLSVRVTDAFRARLEEARKALSRMRGKDVTISEAAMQMLESARDDRLDVVDLLSKPTEAMLEIRRKGEAGQLLSLAEWTVLAHFVQQGAEAQSQNRLSRETLVEVLKAFGVIYALRTKDASSWDGYYLGNLPSSPHRADGLSDPVTPDVVRRAIAETVKVSAADNNWTPVFAGRNLYVLLDQEKFSSVHAINDALRPYWPVLWRVAARGHYAIKEKPVRDESKQREYAYQPQVPSTKEGEFTLSFTFSQEKELLLLLSFPGPRGAMYPISRYPEITEFRAMLANLRPKSVELGGGLIQSGHWDGMRYYGYVTERGKEHEYWFRACGDGITFGFTEAEWGQVRALFQRAWEIPEIKLAWDALSLEYGEL
jgi:hypothetical protein